MNTQTPQYPAPNQPRPAAPLYRPASGRMVGGVCAAIANRFGWDRTLVRLAAAATFFLPGPNVLAYIIAWVVIPSEERYWEQQASAQR